MSILPSNERRDIKSNVQQGLRVWLYAAPYVGKTTFADAWPNPINLNTDGNIKFVTMPYITITDQVGRNGKDAWQVFKEAVDDLLKGGHGFETVVVDLVEDVYQFARDHHNNEQGWLHESEPGFAKGYDLIRNDFLGELRRLGNSGMNVVLLSHQTDRVIKSRTGKETVVYSPNLSDKVAIKVAGMVDITARAYMDTIETDDGVEDVRKIQMVPTANEFATGGRLKTEAVIPLNYEDFKATMEAAMESTIGGKPEPKKPEKTSTKDPEVKPRRSKRAEPKPEPVEVEEPIEDDTIADRDMYFQHDGTGEIVMVPEGDKLPDDFLNGGPEILDIVDEKAYLDYLKSIAPVEEPKPERKPRRTRTPKSEEPVEEPVEEPAEEAAPRRRRRRELQ